MLALVRLYRSELPGFNGNHYHYLVEGIPSQHDNMTNCATSVWALARSVETKIHELRTLRDVDDIRVTFDPPAHYILDDAGSKRRCHVLARSEQDEFNKAFLNT